MGGFVEVQYGVSDTLRIATLIKTHVAPGEGLENQVGILTSRPSDNWGTWIINSVSYQGDPAIVVELSAAQTPAFSARSANATAMIVHVNAYVSNSINTYAYPAHSWESDTASNPLAPMSQVL